jgi:hypothetical protein
MKRRFLFMLMAAFTFMGANAAINRANNYLKAADVTAKQGQTVDVALTMVNKTFDIINWQTELVLPEGVTLVSVAPAERWSEEIVVTDNKLFSETENAVATGEGVVAKITLQVASTVAEGSYDIALKSTVMHAKDNTEIAQTDPQYFKLTVEKADEGKKGDLNGDGKVTASDIQVVLNAMADEDNNPAYDLNGDGKVTASDIQIILNIMAEE